MLAMMLLTALPGGVMLTARRTHLHLICQLGQVPYVPPHSGRPSSAQDGDSRKGDGAITGPSVPLGQSELIIGTEPIVGDLLSSKARRREDVGSASGPASLALIWWGRRVGGLGPGLTSESADAALGLSLETICRPGPRLWHPPALPV